MTAAGAVRLSTSVDVAGVAGVSRTPVSRILRGVQAAFPEATRLRILVAAAKLDYCSHEVTGQEALRGSRSPSSGWSARRARPRHALRPAA